MKISVILPLLGMAASVHAKQLSTSDSILLRAYGNKILPKAELSQNDIIYLGIENLITIDCPVEAAQKMKLFVCTQNGAIEKKDENYWMIPKKTGKTAISVHWITSDNDTILLRKKYFDVQRLPDPILKIGNTIINNEGRIGKGCFTPGDSLKLYYTNDLAINEKIGTVKYFTIGYSYGGVYMSNDNDGAVISNPNVQFIKKIAPGKEVIIRVMSASQPKCITQLPMIRFFLY
jgi:hypothetical protein